MLILTFAHFSLCCYPRDLQFPSSKIPVSSAFGSTLPLSSWAERANFRSTDWNASNHVMRMAVRGRPHTYQHVRCIYPCLSMLTQIGKHHRNIRWRMHIHRQICSDRFIMKLVDLWGLKGQERYILKSKKRPWTH
jgi:hypothetical protein